VITLFAIFVFILRGFLFVSKIPSVHGDSRGQPSVVWFWTRETSPLGTSSRRERSRGVRLPNRDLYHVRSRLFSILSAHTHLYACPQFLVPRRLRSQINQRSCDDNEFLLSHLSFFVLFYNHRLNKAVGYGLAFRIQAIASTVFGFGGIGILLAFGGNFRSRPFFFFFFHLTAVGPVMYACNIQF
jgi:hypothetical protein